MIKNHVDTFVDMYLKENVNKLNRITLAKPLSEAKLSEESINSSFDNRLLNNNELVSHSSKTLSLMMEVMPARRGSGISSHLN